MNFILLSSYLQDTNDQLYLYSTKLKEDSWMKTKINRGDVLFNLLCPLAKFLIKKKIKYEFCGSYRRGKKELGDVDIVITPPKEAISLFMHHCFPTEELKILWQGESKTAVVVMGIQLDFRISCKKNWGAAILTATGPAGFNVDMRSKAKKRGLLLNEYGLFKRNTMECIASETEREIFRMLKMNYLEPYDRKNPEWWEQINGSNNRTNELPLTASRENCTNDKISR